MQSNDLNVYTFLNMILEFGLAFGRIKLASGGKMTSFRSERTDDLPLLFPFQMWNFPHDRV